MVTGACPSISPLSKKLKIFAVQFVCTKGIVYIMRLGFYMYFGNVAIRFSKDQMMCEEIG